MGTLESLFAQYSIESIILILVAVAISFKFIGDLWDWFYNRVKKRFNIQSEQQQQDEKMHENIEKLTKTIEDFSEKTDENFKTVNESIDTLKFKQERTTERLQENTRSFIIDKHHYFCYKIKAIDDMNLQSLERRYMYYKADGGDSFIDQLMEEIRQLPRVNLQHKFDEVERDGIM